MDREFKDSNVFQISWSRFIRSIYSLVGVSVCEEDQIIVMEPDYLMGLMPLLQRTPPRVIGEG